MGSPRLSYEKFDGPTSALEHLALAFTHLWRALLALVQTLWSGCRSCLGLRVSPAGSRAGPVPPGSPPMRSKKASMLLASGMILFDEWDKKPSPVPKGIIIPESKPKRIWDMLVLGIILYSAFAVPVEICFDAFPAVGSLIFSFECMVSAAFVLDMALNLHVAALNL